MSRRCVRLVDVILLLGMVLPTLLIGAQSDETATVTSGRAPVHSEPSAQSEVLVNVERGTLLSIDGFDETTQWVDVVTPDGGHGWVSAVHVHVNGAYHPSAADSLYTIVDGEADDWSRFGGAFEDALGDSVGEADLRSIRSYFNDQFLYVLIETDGDLEAVQLVLIDIVTGHSGAYGTFQYALPQRGVGSLFVLTETSGEARGAADVVTARGTAIEIRLPLVLLDMPETVSLVKVSFIEDTAAGTAVSDEAVGRMPAVTPFESEPVPDAVVAEARVNLRQTPVNGEILRILEPGTALALVGRNEDADWLLVRLADGSGSGWVSAEFVRTEVALLSLRIQG